MNPLVFSTINIILREVKQLKWSVMEVVDQKKFKQAMEMKSIGKHPESSQLMAKALEPFSDPNINQLIKSPNECQSWTEMMEEAFGFWYSTGNSFTYGLKPTGMDIFTKVYGMPAQFTQIVSNGWMMPVDKYIINWSNDIKQAIPAESVYHYKKFNPKYDQSGSQLYGLSPMAPLSKVVNRSNENYAAGLAIIQNGMPAGVLSADAAAKPPGPDDIKAGENKLRQKFGGGKNANKILMTSLPLKWQKMGLNVGDMQLIETNKADAQDIAKAYGVPLPLVSTDASTFNNMNTAKKMLWENVIIPDVTGFAQGFGEWLLAGYEKQTGKQLILHFDTSMVAALQDDLNKLSERLLKEMAHGLWTPNQVRTMLGRPTEADSEHLNQYVMSNSLKSIGDEDKQSE